LFYKTDAEVEEESDYVIEGDKIMKQKMSLSPEQLVKKAQVLENFYSTTVNPMDFPHRDQVTTEMTNKDAEKIHDFQVGLEELIQHATTNNEASNEGLKRPGHFELPISPSVDQSRYIFRLAFVSKLYQAFSGDV